eukprot:g38418.t1
MPLFICKVGASGSLPLPCNLLPLAVQCRLPSCAGIQTENAPKQKQQTGDAFVSHINITYGYCSGTLDEIKCSSSALFVYGSCLSVFAQHIEQVPTLALGLERIFKEKHALDHLTDHISSTNNLWSCSTSFVPYPCPGRKFPCGSPKCEESVFPMEITITDSSAPCVAATCIMWTPAQDYITVSSLMKTLASIDRGLTVCKITKSALWLPQT